MLCTTIIELDPTNQHFLKNNSFSSRDDVEKKNSPINEEVSNTWTSSSRA
jgi:hypothetical protein